MDDEFCVAQFCRDISRFRLNGGSMRSRLMLAAVGATLLTSVVVAEARQQRQHMNPVIDLLVQKKPVFGVTQPVNARGGGGGGGRGGRGRGAAASGADSAALAAAQAAQAAAAAAAAAANPPVVKTPQELAKDGVAYRGADFFFNGNMEGSVDRAIGPWTEFVTNMGLAGWITRTPAPRMTHALAVKTPAVGPDSVYARTIENVSKQLNSGASILHFVKLETADQLQRGIAAMRFKSKGGTRPDDVGTAPATWGLTEAQYRDKADVWPLNPNGELLAAPIVESKLGVENIREIAAVKGIGVLVIGAGTLGGVYSNTDSTGQRVRDTAGFDAAVARILAACKEFNVACGYPVDERNVEEVVKRGFNFLIIQQWGEGAFRTVDLGKKAGGR
jgi:2-keto-3-deoxy-L-rhamnonate aldolase RhmA